MFNSIAVQPGQAPTPLADQIPDGATVINTDPTNTVYLSSEAYVGPNNGVPIRPLASISKTGTGPAYAILDSNVKTSVSVLVTDEYTDYSDPVALAVATAQRLQSIAISNPNDIGTAVGGAVPVPPSATAIGTQVAGKTNALGIPDLPQSTVLFPRALVPATTAQNIDVSEVASVLVQISNSASNGNITLTDAGGNIVLTEDIALNGSLFRINTVDATTLTVTVNATCTLTVSGSNREYPYLFDARQGYSNVLALNPGSHTYAAGDDFALTGNAACHLQGLIFGRFAISNTTVKGYFYAKDADGFQILLADTSEMSTMAGAAEQVIKTCALPANSTIFFHCTTAGTASISVQLVSASL